MITEDKVTEIFCMADDFCKFFHAMTAKYGFSGCWSDKVCHLCLEFEVMSHGGTERTEDYKKYSTGCYGGTVGAWSDGAC